VIQEEEQERESCQEDPMANNERGAPTSFQDARIKIFHGFHTFKNIK
jgi:hypothetical protein